MKREPKLKYRYRPIPWLTRKLWRTCNVCSMEFRNEIGGVDRTVHLAQTIVVGLLVLVTTLSFCSLPNRDISIFYSLPGSFIITFLLLSLIRLFIHVVCNHCARSQKRIDKIEHNTRWNRSFEEVIKEDE